MMSLIFLKSGVESSATHQFEHIFSNNFKNVTNILILKEMSFSYVLTTVNIYKSSHVAHPWIHLQGFPLFWKFMIYWKLSLSSFCFCPQHIFCQKLVKVYVHAVRVYKKLPSKIRLVEFSKNKKRWLVDFYCTKKRWTKWTKENWNKSWIKAEKVYNFMENSWLWECAWNCF